MEKKLELQYKRKSQGFNMYWMVQLFCLDGPNLTDVKRFGFPGRIPRVLKLSRLSKSRIERFCLNYLGYLSQKTNFVLMDNNQPIGIFDSGIGGTSIWKEIHNLLPNENKYLADSKNYTDKKR
jgi:hypothetical protein